jgi:hypothetical protein
VTFHPIPPELAAKISADAVKNARELMKGFGWSDKSLQALQPKPGQGEVGILTTQKYLIYQEKGTQPFLMHWVAGRTLPLSCPQGDGPHFRRGGHVGEPGYVDIPHRGKVWRDQRWRHPGLKGRNFMRDGLNKAIADNQPLVQAWAVGLLKGSKG